MSSEYPRLEPEDLGFLSHDLFETYWLSERYAILCYRRELQIYRGEQHDLPSTIQRWEAGDGRRWRRAKTKLDFSQQFEEIDRHKYVLSERRGFDVGRGVASRDWVSKYAADWRDWWETQLQANPFLDQRYLPEEG